MMRALREVHDPNNVTAIVNVGDDLVMHGLTICPDLDTITYTLAGLNNEELGWGLTGETWRVMDELAALGGEAWFRLGDRDLATHLYRSERLRQGATKSQVAHELALHHGVPERLIPVTNDPLATMLMTELGELSFQQYFVGHHHDIEVRAVRFDGAENASPAPGVLDSIREAERIVIAPSNPLISIDPILAVPGVREALEQRRSDVVAVSPIIGGKAIKGPADRLLRELGSEASSRAVAAHYVRIASRIVIDEVDDDQAGAIKEMGIACDVTTTLMSEPGVPRRLAEVVLA